MNLKTTQTNQVTFNSSEELIGKLCDSRFAYFDNRAQEYKYKLRPVLIIGVERQTLPCDITVFPVSKITRTENIHKVFDYPLTKERHSNLNLKYDPSYVRVHKITTIHSKDLSFSYTNHQLNETNPEVLEDLYKKYEEFSKNLF